MAPAAGPVVPVVFCQREPVWGGLFIGGMDALQSSLPVFRWQKDHLGGGCLSFAHFRLFLTVSKYDAVSPPSAASGALREVPGSSMYTIQCAHPRAEASHVRTRALHGKVPARPAATSLSLHLLSCFRLHGFYSNFTSGCAVFFTTV